MGKGTVRDGLIELHANAIVSQSDLWQRER